MNLPRCKLLRGKSMVLSKSLTILLQKEQLDIKFAFVSRSDGLGAGLKHLF